MERYASTLATTAACVGLLVAGHLAIVHERASVPDAPVQVQRIAATAEAAETRTWADPPAKIELAAKPERSAAAPVFTMLTAPEAEPAGEPAAEAQPEVQQTALKAESKAESKPDLKAEKAKRAAEQARRKRLAQAKERRTRTAARDLPVDQAAQDEAPRSEPAPARKADPIGDLLRGLGIGREG